MFIVFSSRFSDPAYLRDVGAVAHIHPAALQNFHATSLASNSAAAAMNAANAAAAIAAAEVAHKRPRLDLSHPPQGPVAGSSNAGPPSNSISQPLRIDTRDQPKVSPKPFLFKSFFCRNFTYSAKIHFVSVKVVVKKSDTKMCNLFLDIILFAILLIFMVLLMILPDTTQTMCMYCVCT